jgi:hypothetical protein
MLKNIVEADRKKKAIQWYAGKVGFSCRISEARTQTHS